jgi:hypothetical protein
LLFINPIKSMLFQTIGRKPVQLTGGFAWCISFLLVPRRNDIE